MRVWFDSYWMGALAMTKIKNPAKIVVPDDLFNIDPETLTEAQSKDVIAYYRAQRAKFEEIAASGKRQPRAKKKDPLDTRSGDIK